MTIGIPADKLASAITPHTPQTAAPTHSASRAAAVPSAAPTTAIPAQADPSLKVQLSNTASSLLSGGASTEFNAEKVAQISKAINSGSFRINPEAIADKLIANAQEALGKVSP